ncbi:uncharacterized protein An04g02310 [Aspergillus niger]|uniref:Contig An04c0100, genomic contig n=2 Tax=Aspergillus niger TaxID=5061 RepID=A2QI53_ASPNC|nr:uncharacterized protein An04g02310 [Aspergillus niger]CAL00718.1 unnamed protein product [Aspergillus niger]
MSKKNKGKKVADPNETSKLLAAKISQLEQDAAGEKDQEAEIEREVKKATRDLNQLLSNIESPMTRLETVHKKYTELLADMKKLDRDYSKSKKRADQLQKDQDKGKSELNKTVTMKDKLEKLCRELTKENKKVKDENKKLEETEKKARLIVNERLDSLLYDIQDVMAAKGNPRSEKADIDLDEALRAKIKTIGEKFEMRELHYKALLRSKDAEIQCLTAKYEEQRRTAENEAARCRALSSQVSTFSHTEAELRSQLNIYVEKFKQVWTDVDGLLGLSLVLTAGNNNIAGGGYAEQQQRAFSYVSQRNGRDVQKDQTAREGKPHPYTEARSNEPQHTRDGGGAHKES